MHVPALQPNDTSGAGCALLGLGQWKGEQEGGPFIGARYVNVAGQTFSQLADDRKPATAPDRFRHRPVVRDHEFCKATCKHQLDAQFRKPAVELCMSRYIGQQFGCNQPKPPAPLTFKPQVVR